MCFVKKEAEINTGNTFHALALYTLCLKKNDNDVLRYNFNAHQPILIIFGIDIAEWICY